MTKTARTISPHQGKLAVLLPGLGAVATTFIAGCLLARRGLGTPVGSMTQLGTIRLGKRTENRVPKIKDFVNLAPLQDLVFGGWDIFPDSALESARNAGVLEEKHLAPIAEELEAIVDLAPQAVARVRAAPDLPAISARALRRIDAVVRDAVIARLDSMKAHDLKVIDVRGKTSITDCLVIVSGTSTRHVKSMGDEVVVTAKKLGLPPIGIEGEKDAEWMLVDLGDTVVHVMLPKMREFYGLERLWMLAEESRAAAVNA